MSDEWDEKGNFLSDGVRLGKLGRILRATSSDELPKAFNILKGDRDIIRTNKENVDFMQASAA